MSGRIVGCLVASLTSLACGGGGSDTSAPNNQDGEDAGSTQDAGGEPSNTTTGPASCTALGEHLAKTCGQDATFEAELCTEDRLLYEPIGCGAEYAEFVRCYSQASIPDCEDGAAEDCPGPEIYGRCVQAFAASTGCSRLPSMDVECATGTYGYTCGEVPSGCTKLDSGGSLATFACCKSFAKDTTEHFVD